MPLNELVSEKGTLTVDTHNAHHTNTERIRNSSNLLPVCFLPECTLLPCPS